VVYKVANGDRIVQNIEIPEKISNKKKLQKVVFNLKKLFAIQKNFNLKIFLLLVIDSKPGNIAKGVRVFIDFIVRA
jgi:hypothetical protein